MSELINDSSVSFDFVHPLVSRVASMNEAEIQSAIDANHPALDKATHAHLKADALAMKLIHGRHGKREIVNLIRWVLMGAPDVSLPAQQDRITAISSPCPSVFPCERIKVDLVVSNDGGLKAATQDLWAEENKHMINKIKTIVKNDALDSK